IVGIDESNVHIGQNARQRGRFQLAELQLLGIVDHISGRRQNVGRILQLDQALGLQQEQGARAVGWIVGQCHLRAFLQVLDVLDLGGIRAERLDVHQPDAYQSRLVFFVERIQIRLVLEEIDVDLAIRYLLVRLHIIGEYLDVELHALLGQDRLDQLEQLRMRNRRCRHAQLGCLGGANGKQRGRRERQYRRKFLQEHKKLLDDVISGSVWRRAGRQKPATPEPLLQG